MVQTVHRNKTVKVPNFRVLVLVTRCLLCTLELGHLFVPEGLWKLIEKRHTENLLAWKIELVLLSTR